MSAHRGDVIYLEAVRWPVNCFTRSRSLFNLILLASVGAQENWQCTHIGHQCCDQLTAVKTGYPLTRITWPYRELRCRPIEVKYFFFKLSASKLLIFKWLQAQVQFILKLIWNMLCLCAEQLNFWFQTELRRENLASYYRQRKQLHLTLHTMFMRFYHALRPIFMFWLVKIWQVSSCGKFMQHLESCLLCLLWQLRLTKFCVNLWCF